MKFRQKNHYADMLFTALLLLIFALFTLILSGMGSTIYQSGVTYLNRNYTSRTAISYVSEKVRQHEEEGSVFLTEVEGLTAIGLRDTINDQDFITYIYYYDGALRELFIRSETVPQANMGSEIVVLDGFEITQTEPQLWSVTACNEDGSTMSLYLCIRTDLQ